MNANEITFGVEIECTLPVAKMQEIGMMVGRYHAGTQVPNLPIGWNAQSDGSIHATYPMTGVEIVSPILKGADGIEQIKTVCKWLATMGAKVDASCGFHVHVGFSGRSARQLAQLVCLVARNEKALYAMTGTKGRENNHYCKSVKASFRPLGSRGSFRSCATASSDRYHALNLTHVARGGQTVEFRCFAGTLNVFKMLAYVQVCVGLVQKAIKTKSKISYDAKDLSADNSTLKTEGEGETAVNRLFYQLFWKFNGGFRAGIATDPKWTPLGILDEATLARSGKLALAMARKYDAN